MDVLPVIEQLERLNEAFAYLVALVVPGPDRQAGGGVHQR
jgi:hypothetical protein